MKLVDTDETVVLVTGASITAEERDLPLAQRLKAEIDRRGDGLAYRRAVVVSDAWYLENRLFHLNPTIAIGGPGANGVSPGVLQHCCRRCTTGTSRSSCRRTSRGRRSGRPCGE